MESQKKLDVQEKPTVCDKRDPEKVDLEKIDLEAPPDRFYIIYILFFFLGLVHFLPWSFFTTATEYWMFKFRNTTINETDSEFRTDLQASFSASLKVTLQVSDIVFLTLSMMFGRFIRVRVRMIGVLTVILTLFVIVTIFTKIDTDSWQEGFFVMVMGIISGINAMNAIFTITMYTIIANFPHHYLAPYLTGGGLSKIFTSILQIISLTLGLGTTNSALVYFCMGVFVIVFTLTAFIATGRNKFYLYHMRNFQEGQKEKMITFKEGFRLLKKIWSSVVMMGLFLLSVDASPTALVVSEDEGSGPWSDIYFIPTITFLLSGVCDLIGRGTAFKFTPKISGIGWTIFAVIRIIIFVPLFIFCNAQPRHHLPVLLPHDYQYIVILTVYSLSGGYLLSRCSYNISRLVTKEELKNAYHVNMLFGGLQMAALSFVSIVSVKLL